MDYGFVIGTRPPLATPECNTAMVQKGEELGFGMIAVADHVVPPSTFEDIYPYSDTGESRWGPSGHVLEMLTLLSFVAGQTTRLKLLTSVMVVPFRHPVLTAKMLATLDVLSHGRVIVGCGVGWERLEHGTLASAPFNQRGAIADEYIELFREVWTNDQPSFEGSYARFTDMPFMPKPLQKPHPPIWIGGESDVALRRTVRFGEAWYPAGANPRHRLDHPALYAEAVGNLKRIAEQHSRDPATIDLGYFSTWYNENEAETLDDGRRRAFTGSADDIVDDIGRMREAGLRHLVFNLNAPSLEATLDRMERFAGDIIAKSGG